MKIKLSVFLLLLISFTTKAQLFPFNDLRGVAMRSTSYIEVTGNPYFKESWVDGLVKDNAGKSYKDVPLKFDEVKQILLFKKDGEILEFSEQITEFSLLESSGNTRLNFRRLSLPNSNKFFYGQELYVGKIGLFKANLKVIKDVRPFNSAAVIKEIEPNVRYFYNKDEKLVAFKPDKKTIETIFVGNKDKVNDYIKKNGLKLSNDQDLIEIFKYHDTL